MGKGQVSWRLAAECPRTAALVDSMVAGVTLPAKTKKALVRAAIRLAADPTDPPPPDIVVQTVQVKVRPGLLDKTAKERETK
jgi:hypothetical protein